MNKQIDMMRTKGLRAVTGLDLTPKGVAEMKQFFGCYEKYDAVNRAGQTIETDRVDLIEAP